MYKRCEQILKELENEGKLKVWWDFKFPEKEPLKLRLKDMLEEQVDEKYYLSDTGIIYFQKQAEKRGEDLTNYNDGRMLTVAHGQSIGSNKDLSICPTLDTQFSNNWRGVVLEPKILEDFYKNRPAREYEEVAPTLRSERIGLKVVEPQDSILVKNATKKGYDEAIDGDSINLSYPESTTRRGRVGHGVAQTLQCNDSMGVVEKEYERTPLTIGDNQIKIEDYPTIIQKCGDRGTNNYSKSNISYTIPSNAMSDRGQLLIQPNLRIRKLTPKECWRLMGFDDEDFEKAKNALNEKFYKGKDKSSSQLYKQARKLDCRKCIRKNI